MDQESIKVPIVLSGCNAVLGKCAGDARDAVYQTGVVFARRRHTLRVGKDVMNRVVVAISEDRGVRRRAKQA